MFWAIAFMVLIVGCLVVATWAFAPLFDDVNTPPNRISAWIRCHLECGVTDCAVYSCERDNCPGRVFWRSHL